MIGNWLFNTVMAFTGNHDNADFVSGDHDTSLGHSHGPLFDVGTESPNGGPSNDPDLASDYIPEDIIGAPTMDPSDNPASASYAASVFTNLPSLSEHASVFADVGTESPNGGPSNDPERVEPPLRCGHANMQEHNAWKGRRFIENGM